MRLWTGEKVRGKMTALPGRNAVAVIIFLEGKEGVCDAERGDLNDLERTPASHLALLS